MARKSSTHRIAVLRQDNGELQEEVVGRRVVEGEPPRAPADPADLDRVADEQSTGSFPASDPPSSWSGTEPRRGGAEESEVPPEAPASPSSPSARPERVVHSAPVDEVPERQHPAAPVPGTLPR